MTGYDSAHVIGSRPSGGAERFYVRLVCALARAGHGVLAVYQPGAAVGREIAATATVPVASETVRMRGVWDLLARARLRRLVRRSRPAVVQTYMGRATRLLHIPRGGASVHVARLGGYYDLSGYRHAHAWIGNSRGICDYLVAGGMPPARVHYIGNFVDARPPADTATRAALRARFGLPEEALAVVFVGRLHPHKGVATLLEAFGSVAPSIGARPVHLLIAGDGPLAAELRAQAAQLPIRGRVHWTGWLDEPDDVYALADLCVCPSVHEPLGNVVLEAWSHAKPVVATRSQGPLELITDGEDGLLVPIAEPAALAGAVSALLRGGDEALASLGAAGARTLAREHAEAGVVGAYLALYGSLVGTS